MNNTSEVGNLPLSVIICTFNRCGLLLRTLDSLVEQTLDQNEYEVVVIDDGSTDDTRNVVEGYANRLPLTYFYQQNSGLAASKNHGIYASRSKILFFMDDDDVALPTLLEEHLKSHKQYPNDNFGVLNYTCWSPDLTVSPLMHFITEEGCFLFSYPYIKHGDILDYTNFWGGRSSCKRSFLINYGVFNQIFRFGCEDIELGYRLSKHDLKVVYNAKAISMMIRPITFDDFCKRLIKQGRSQYVFSQLSNDPEVDRYTEVPEIEEKWLEMETLYEARIHSARELDKIVNLRMTYGFEIDDLTKRLLHKAYWRAFRACKIKGMIEAKENSN